VHHASKSHFSDNLLSRVSLVTTFLCSVLFYQIGFSQTVHKQFNAPSTSLPTHYYRWNYFDINNIKATINNYGPFADYLRTSSAGLEWPKGSRKTALFSAGIWIAGIHRPTGELRTAIQYYQSEYQAGPIAGVFNTTTIDSTVISDPSDNRYRVYKLNKTYSDTMADSQQWPGDLGAPYIDVNANGTWERGIDKPNIFADQLLWSVYNDAFYKNRDVVKRTKPMGIEIQASYFGWDYVFLKDIMFLRWKVINKSNAYYDSVFFGIWNDPDLGNLNDDGIGVDISRNLVYTYNCDDVDQGANGYQLSPPAYGIVLLQGPNKKTSMRDSAYFNDSWHRGFQSLQITSFVPTFSLTDCDDCDILFFAHHMYNMLNGFNAEGTPFIDPHTTTPTKFVFSGDPVTQVGWYQSDSLSIGGTDVRGVVSAGPFTFAPNDTQEVIAAIILSQKENRLASITKLRFVTDLTREFFYDKYQIFENTPPAEDISSAPQEFFLTQNFPNPFNPTTTISFAVPDMGNPLPTKLAIYDVLGRTVSVLINQSISAGLHSVEWNAAGLASGVYYYSLSIGGMVQTKKMILQR